MEETKKKRKAYSTPEAQSEANKRWRDKNVEKARYNSRKSVAKNFITKFLKIEDAEVFKGYIEERIKQLKEA